MILIGSLALATSVLSLSLMIQSKMLIVDEVKRAKLNKLIQKMNYIGSGPLGLIMVVAGCIWWDKLKDSFIPVGMTLIIASISMLVQSRTLELNGNSAIRFGKYLNILAWILAISSTIGLIAVVFLLIRGILTA